MSAKIISLDFELCSTLDLTDVGAYEWTTNKNTIPILAGFALDHEEPLCVDFTHLGAGTAESFIARQIQQQLLNAVAQGAEIHAWNANFEFNVWNNICVPRFGWPALGIEGSSAQCARLLAPGSPCRSIKPRSLWARRTSRTRRARST